MADLLRQKSTWVSDFDDVAIRWFKSATKMKWDDFDLSGYRSCIGLVPLNMTVIGANGKEQLLYGFQLLFTKKHEDHSKDFDRADIVISKKGKTFYSVDKADALKPDCKLYLSNLPFDISLEDLQKTFEDYVDFSRSTQKIYHFTNGVFSGQIMLVVSSIRKVPARRQRIKSGPYANFGFNVTVRGQSKTVPMEKVSKPCFCCKSLEHEVKNCPTKKEMQFTWKCTKCSLHVLGCYQDNCAVSKMAKEVMGTAKELLVKDGKPTTNYLEQNNETINEKIQNLYKVLESQRQRWRDADQTSTSAFVENNHQGLALRRYFERALENYKSKNKGVWDVNIYEKEFEIGLCNDMKKLNYDGVDGDYPEPMTDYEEVLEESLYELVSKETDDETEDAGYTDSRQPVDFRKG